MNMILTSQWIQALFIFSGVFGVALCLLGTLFTFYISLGNKHWVWSIAILFTGPISGIPYTFAHKVAGYPKSIMIKGFILLVLCSVYFVMKKISIGSFLTLV